MRRPGRGGTPPKKYGTPTVEPEPQAIDPASGFKVPLRSLVRQWDNQLIFERFVDKRNPQDFVRGVKDDQSLPYARPETPDTFIAGPLIWQDGSLMFGEDGSILLTQGIDPLDTL
jgi:hypothetical protein